MQIFAIISITIALEQASHFAQRENIKNQLNIFCKPHVIFSLLFFGDVSTSSTTAEYYDLTFNIGLKYNPKIYH